MSDLADILAGPVRDLHDQGGDVGEIVNYEDTSADDWDYSGWDDESDTSSSGPLDPVPITIRVERTAQARTRFGPSGVEIDADVVIFVNPAELDERDTEIVEAGGDRQASIITDPSGPTPTRYRVTRVDDDNSGLWLCQAERLDDDE